MNFKRWFSQRGFKFIVMRGWHLIRRYGFNSVRTQKRIQKITDSLTKLGCLPTLPTPGIVIKRHPNFLQKIQAAGAEIAVHGYVHIDYKSISAEQSFRLFEKACQEFTLNKIEYHGFRCPYLSCSDEILASFPLGMFGYSSNQAILWDVLPDSVSEEKLHAFNIMNRWYFPQSAENMVCVPRIKYGLVEIPVCIPDDLQLLDCLKLEPEAMAQVWIKLLNQTHRRGEIFNIMFHPEISDFCEQPLVAVLQNAKAHRPGVWVAQLKDINEWWREKAGFITKITGQPEGLQVSFSCTKRATILSRGLDFQGEPWFDDYIRLTGESVPIPPGIRPFIGVSGQAPTQWIKFLHDQGYILDTSAEAPGCSVHLTAEELDETLSEVALIERIEKSKEPLLRYWRWPDGFRSALCITGDLDALSLWDYTTRFFVPSGGAGGRNEL